MKNATKILLSVGVLLCLLQVWLPAYYLTGDGPCHLYNAQILHDSWCHTNTSFYSCFYYLVYQPYPNLLSTVVLALLPFIAKGVIAEKIFLTLYVLLFTGGFYLLLKKISTNPYWPLVLLLFVFPHVLAKGFYNYAFSIAFYFWMIWGWLRFLDRGNARNAVVFFICTGLLFFTHLLSFMFGAFTCAALVASYALAIDNGSIKNAGRKLFVRAAAWLAIFLMPFLLLAHWFTDKEGGMQLHQLRPHFYRLIELAEFKYLINMRHTEDLFAAIAGVSLLFLFGLSVFGSREKFRVSKYDGFLLSLLFVFFVYLCFPEAFMGKLILITMRAQPVVFILIACCIACRFPASPDKIRCMMLTGAYLLCSLACIGYLVHRAGGSIDTAAPLGAHIAVCAAAFAIVLLLAAGFMLFHRPFKNIRSAGVAVILACFTALTVARISCLLDLAPQVADYLSAASYIKPYKVVLPLDFAPSGIDQNGRDIADRNFLFVHAAQYTGTQKPLIFLDNYEAHMGYFPINWVEKQDPYNFFDKHGGIEGNPPYADIINYEYLAGVNVDYILMWCYSPVYLQDPHFAAFYAEIQAGYHKVYTSPAGKTVLYGRN